MNQLTVVATILLSPDVQVIRPTQKNVIDTNGAIPSRRDNVGTATVLSLRAKLVF